MAEEAAASRESDDFVMAWPQKKTRKLTVKGSEFLWHYSGHCPWCSAAVFTIGRAGAPFVLFIDPYPWSFELTPAYVVAAIEWAWQEGWTPEQGPTRAMSKDDATENFLWLPEGERHLLCQKRSALSEQV